MRFIFKTDYNQDIRLFQHGGQIFWYGLLGVLLLAAPFLVSGYVLSQLHFICIYAIVGLGLMLLVGYTGQISLGHAAFLADRRLHRGAAAGRRHAVLRLARRARRCSPPRSASSSGCRRCG